MAKKKNNKSKGDNVDALSEKVEELEMDSSTPVTPIEPKASTLDDLEAMWSDDEKPKKKKKAQNQSAPVADSDDDEPGSTVKTAAQKKKEKKERQKMKKKAQTGQAGPAAVKAEEPKEDEEHGLGEIERLENKKKLTNKEKMKLAMLKQLRDQKEEERQAQILFDKQEADRLAAIEKHKQDELEKERVKEEKKKRKAEKRAQDRRDGVAVTKKEKEAAARKAAFLASRGIEIDKAKTDGGVKNRFKKPSKQSKKQDSEDDPSDMTTSVEMVDRPPAVDSNASTDESDWDDEGTPKSPKVTKPKPSSPEPPKPPSPKLVKKALIHEAGSKTLLAAVKDDPDWAELESFDRVEARIAKRAKVAKKHVDMDVLRSPVICVLGHVDTGKTKILDNLRRTNVQDGEAGGITQQIGATNVNIETVRERTSFVKSLQKIDLPGLLIIDTPGHESFANLRTRGSSLCDLAILVVDVNHSLEQQTIESIELLKKGKTPFVIALNKIDRLYQWETAPNTDIEQTIKQQGHMTKDEFKRRYDQVFADFASQAHLNVKLFWENDDPGTNFKEHYMNVIPTSAHSGDGMGNLMAMVVQMAQDQLRKRVAFSEKVQCTVLEVKSVTGLGTCLDCILTQGRLRYGDTIIVAGSDGPIVTQIKGLVMPQADRDLRVTTRSGGGTEIVKECSAANGVRILGREPLDKSLAGTTLHIAYNADDEEIEYYKNETKEEIDKALKAIRVSKTGVYVQASTLGALEALADFLREKSIPFFACNVGPVHKRDVMRASTMVEQDPMWAIILAFDVKVEREAQQYAADANIKIYTADIIYHLFDAVEDYKKEYFAAKKEEFKHIVKFPCKLQIMPEHIIRNRDPIIIGVKVMAGVLKSGTTLIALSQEHGQVVVGMVCSIESNNKQVDVARDGEEICIKIDGAQGEAPKMLGRHFEAKDLLVSKIDREIINLLKEWYKDEMRTSDWKLVLQLKKLFGVL